MEPGYPGWRSQTRLPRAIICRPYGAFGKVALEVKAGLDEEFAVPGVADAAGVGGGIDTGPPIGT